MDLASEPIRPFTPGTTPLTRREVATLLRGVADWSLEDGRLVRRFPCGTFSDCLAFVRDLGDLAAYENHLPDIGIREGRYVDVSWYSYAAGGLTMNDFAMAARLSERIRSRQGGAL